MPDPRSGRVERVGTDAFDRNTLHEAIVHDDSQDPRYASGLSNQAKTRFLCRIMSYPANMFDLELPFPVEEWIVSDDAGMLCAGLYLSDLRTQFYSKRLDLGPQMRDRYWLRHAEAEFWLERFNNLVTRRTTGMILDENRVLH